MSDRYNQVGRVATTVAPAGEGMTAVTYHRTAVVKFDGARIILDSGGWQTSTTKVRMNQAATVYNLGFWVYAKARQWYVSYKGEDLPFTDGMVLDR